MHRCGVRWVDEVRFRPEALAEYQEAGHFYARQQPGLDLRFVLCIEESIKIIVQAPLRLRRFDREVRRCLTRTFPYGILYTVEPNRLLILAVAHRSREPGYWKHWIT